MPLEFIFGKTVGAPAFEDKGRIRALLDELIAYASESRHAKQLEEAREVFYFKSGKTNEDDPDFVQRMNTFLEWFIFDHRPGGVGSKSLFDRYMAEKRPGLSSGELVQRIALSKHVHSLFQVKSCSGGVVKVRDLASRTTYIVTDDDTLERGDVLEARVVLLGDGCFFTYTHCLHPKGALKSIKTELKKWKQKALDEEFFSKLQGMQLKWRRFRQISINDIYRM
ncbi:MAG: hypothetical protein HZA04_05300 [Nitrospinae bacterium]|nr:hypothetical protein [Nitrospinota bacterium]